MIHSDVASFDQAVDELFRSGYPQSVVDSLNSMGDNPLGFRLAGSPAEHQAAAYLAAEFEDMGAFNVRQEPVPVDAWTLKGAAVRIDGRTLTASQFAGVPGTSGPLAAELTYVGRGTASDYAAMDVSGKWVLVDIEVGDTWCNLQGHEAQLHGAVGIIFTNGANTPPYHTNPECLATQESRWNADGIPAVFVSTIDGDWIKAKLRDRVPLSAVVTSLVEATMHNFNDPASGGIGYNVVAEIPGTDPEAKAILLAAHYDAYFRSALDNTGAVAQMMTIARALKQSGKQFERTVIFFASCGEEYGYIETQYAYLAGAWYAATVAHSSDASDPMDRWTGPEGRLGLFINIEESPQTGSPLRCVPTSDLASWITSLAATESALLPNGFVVREPFSVWNDGAPFVCAGVPTVVTVAENPDYEGFNHTTDDDVALIDYDYMRSLVKFYQRALLSASTGLAAHDPEGQAAHLDEAVSADRLMAAGADPNTVDALVGVLQRYRAATAAYADRRSSITRERWSDVNLKLSALEREWHAALSGIEAHDHHIMYPFDQTLRDIEHMQAAIVDLKAGSGADRAISELEQVGMTVNGLLFSQEVYENYLRRYLPDHPMINWGGQLNQFWHVDITAEVRGIMAGHVASAIDGLEAMITLAIEGADVPGAQSSWVHIDGLNERLDHAAAALQRLTPMVDELVLDA